MSTPDTMPAPPDLPFTLEPGDTPARSTLALVRARGWLVGPIALVLVVSGVVKDGARGAVLGAVAAVAMVLAVAALVLVLVRIASRYRITVTHTELVVERLRRRTVPRTDVGELVLGYFTARPLDPAGRQACLTTRHGKRFATMTILYWPPQGLLQVAAALGIAVRDEDPGLDRRLRPIWVRRPVLFQLSITAAIMAGSAGIVGAVIALA